MVVEEGKPVGVITRYDLLGFLSDGPGRRNRATLSWGRLRYCNAA